MTKRTYTQGTVTAEIFPHELAAVIAARADEARDAHASRLLDHRWHWLVVAKDRLYEELEDGDRIIGVTLTLASGEQVVMYGITAEGPEILRRVITDIPAAFAAGAALAELTVDAAPDLGGAP